MTLLRLIVSSSSPRQVRRLRHGKCRSCFQDSLNPRLLHSLRAISRNHLQRLSPSLGHHNAAIASLPWYAPFHNEAVTLEEYLEDRPQLQMSDYRPVKTKIYVRSLFIASLLTTVPSASDVSEVKDQ